MLDHCYIEGMAYGAEFFRISGRSASLKKSARYQYFTTDTLLLTMY